MRPSLLIVAVVAWSMALPARADRLDDDLDAVWESIWDQRGSPGPLTRWELPLRYRVTGPDAARHRAAVTAAVGAAAKAAGLPLAEAVGASAKDDANLTFQLVDEEDGLDEGVGCETSLSRAENWALVSARIRMRPSQAWECAHHEVMHAMGIPGHPAGKTVLSYFPWRSDVLLDLDKLLLSIWYDRALSAGASPFEVLLVGGRWVARQPGLGVDADVAERRRQAHLEARMREMEAFASGDGDVPRIIKRSGRASASHIEEARGAMAHFLGLAHQRATGVPRDDAKAVSWFQRAAARAHPAAQVQLARALAQGAGIAADPVEAYRWLSTAMRFGSVDAARERVRVELSMTAAQLDRARVLGPR